LDRDDAYHKGCANTQDITGTVLSALQLPYSTCVLSRRHHGEYGSRFQADKRSMSSERIDPSRHRSSNGFYLVDGIRIACGEVDEKQRGLGFEVEGGKAGWTST
jgi:hypothetical protein